MGLNEPRLAYGSTEATPEEYEDEWVGGRDGGGGKKDDGCCWGGCGGAGGEYGELLPYGWYEY